MPQQICPSYVRMNIRTNFGPSLEMLFVTNACVIPDGELDAKPPTSLKRKWTPPPALPQSFFAVFVDGTQRILAGIVRITECCKPQALLDVEQHGVDGYQTLRKTCSAIGITDPSKAMIWHVEAAEPHKDAQEWLLPPEASRRWQGVFGFDARCQVVQEIHRAFNVQLGVKGFLFDHRLGSCVFQGRCWIPTPLSHAKQAGIKIADLKAGCGGSCEFKNVCVFQRS